MDWTGLVIYFRVRVLDWTGLVMYFRLRVLDWTGLVNYFRVRVHGLDSALTVTHSGGNSKGKSPTLTMNIIIWV